MAHIKINKNEFEKLLGEEVPDDYLDEDASYLGVHWNKVNEEKWDVEVYPNRPDLLGVEGLSRAYKGFKGIETGLKTLDPSPAEVELHLDGSVEGIRPFIGGLVVRNLDLTERIINGLIQLQEKLHKTQGREREKIAIGLHDLDSIEPPLTYKAVGPEQYEFQPLEKQNKMNLDQILENHEKGREYGNIISSYQKYPVITDSQDEVLSFPPVINAQKTEVDVNTEEIFVDVTGTDRNTVEKIVNILAFTFQERGAKIEKVDVEGTSWPILETERYELDPDYVREVSGVELSDSKIIENLQKMRHHAKLDDGKIIVETPSYRTDILHQFDLVEDAVIAQDYRKFEPEIPNIHTEGLKHSLEEYTEVVRDLFSSAGAMEANTYILSSEKKLGSKMNLKEVETASMSNALSEEYSTVRNWILPSLLGSLERNRQRSYPQKFFEVGDVVELDESPTGASNCRKAAFVAAGNEVDFNTAKEIIQVIERDLGIDLEVREASHPSFKDKRTGEIVFEGEEIGIIGELSGSVLDNWGLDEVNGVGFEFDLEPVVKYLRVN